MTRRSSPDRRGYVLLVVLWSVVAMAATAAAVLLVAREAIATSANRAALERTQWRLQGCVDHALARLESALREDANGNTVWAALDSVAGLADVSCSLSVRPVGLTLDINRTGESDLVRFTVAAGVGEARAESLAAAIADWRDPDDSSRHGGAEAAWYRSQHQTQPRNGAFASSIEVLRVRGANWLTGIDTLVDADSNRVLLTRAPQAVLAGQASLDAQMVRAIVEARQRGAFPDLMSLARALNEPVRTRFLRALPALLGTATTVPDFWWLEARSLGAEIAVAERLRLARDGSRLAVMDRQTWP